jgi:hypothetical protein
VAVSGFGSMVLTKVDLFHIMAPVQIMSDRERKGIDWNLITDEVLGRVGPPLQRSEVEPKDQYKVAGTADAKSVVLSQDATTDQFAVAERGRK